MFTASYETTIEDLVALQERLYQERLKGRFGLTNPAAVRRRKILGGVLLASVTLLVGFGGLVTLVEGNANWIVELSAHPTPVERTLVGALHVLVLVLGALLVLLLVVLMLFATMRVLMKNGVIARRAARRNPLAMGARTMTATPDGVRIDWKGGQTSVQWDVIRDLLEDDSRFYLMISPVQAFVIPKTALGSNIDWFRQAVNEARAARVAQQGFQSSAD
ncbi:MAG: YcxB family protein [Sandaracinaceae bacterium]|nr:YcxB family protein [Sandaracinaceae bacterium]